jgi:hypothetical protein
MQTDSGHEEINVTLYMRKLRKIIWGSDGEFLRESTLIESV